MQKPFHGARNDFCGQSYGLASSDGTRVPRDMKSLSPGCLFLTGVATACRTLGVQLHHLIASDVILPTVFCEKDAWCTMQWSSTGSPTQHILPEGFPTSRTHCSLSRPFFLPFLVSTRIAHSGREKAALTKGVLENRCLENSGDRGEHVLNGERNQKLEKKRRPGERFFCYKLNFIMLAGRWNTRKASVEREGDSCRQLEWKRTGKPSVRSSGKRTWE